MFLIYSLISENIILIKTWCESLLCRLKKKTKGNLVQFVRKLLALITCFSCVNCIMSLVSNVVQLSNHIIYFF